MVTRQDFFLIPWQQDFLDAMVELLLEQTQGNLSDAVLIVPHTRPARYLAERLRRHPTVPKPLLLPQVIPVAELFSRIRIETESAAPLSLELLDQVGLLWQCVQELAAAKQLDLPFPLEDVQRFFPWGIRLAKLMEDFFIHAIVPTNYSYLEGEVADFAAVLLANLSGIYQRYVALLNTRDNLTHSTRGYDAFRVIQNMPQYPVDNLFSGKQIFITGFYSLTGTEDVLFRKLWEERGAHICLHADPRLAQRYATSLSGRSSEAGLPSGQAHWSCKELERWMRRWSAQCQLFTDISDACLRHEPQLVLREAFDLHSQLQGLAEELQAIVALDAKNAAETEMPIREPLQSTAIVLADTALLLPVLHHMPVVDYNISMGYPLQHSPLAQLIATLLQLQEGALQTASGTLYHWQQLIDCIRHPYIKRLGLARELPIYELLQRIEQLLRTGQPFVRPHALLHLLREAEPDLAEAAAWDALDHIFTVTIIAFSELHSPKDMAVALDALCQLLLGENPEEHAVWQGHAIDAECLYRLLHSIIPHLGHAILAESPLEAPVLFALLRELLQAERVPFEADPLLGVQLLGLLETRLLSFDTVFIIDATDDRLPGVTGHDALFPEALRSVVGLPSLRQREEIAGYHFFRLLAGAQQVVISWQEAMGNQSLLDDKKVKSRFVEELIWKQELRQKALWEPVPVAAGENNFYHDSSTSLEPNSGSTQASVFERYICAPRPARMQDSMIHKTTAVQERLHKLLSSPISASLLDAYLRCPLRFFYERVLGLAQLDSVQEGEDPQAVGVLLHDVLAEFFRPHLQRRIIPATLGVGALQELFRARLAASELLTRLPKDALAMLRVAGPERLALFLEEQQEAVTILHIEERFRAPLMVDALPYTLQGILDRIDLRGEGTAQGLVVIDYKTGALPSPVRLPWDDDSFWHSLDAWTPDMPVAKDPFFRLAPLLDSVQLPVYLYLLAACPTQFGHMPQNANWVELAKEGKEVPLLGAKIIEDGALLEIIVQQRIPQLLRFLIRHMRYSPCFFPQRAIHCDWCSFSGCCRVAL